MTDEVPRTEEGHHKQSQPGETRTQEQCEWPEGEGNRMLALWHTDPAQEAVNPKDRDILPVDRGSPARRESLTEDG